MEQRLFAVACIMYAFTLFTRYLNKKNKLNSNTSFAWWHAGFLFIILSCAVYVLTFVMGGGAGEPLNWSRLIWGIVLSLGCAIYGLLKGKKATDDKRKKMMKADLEWSNTVYFAGFVASIVMFFFIQAFKIPSASMRYTLVEGDHLFVNKPFMVSVFRLQKFALVCMNKLSRGILLFFNFPLMTALNKIVAVASMVRILLSA